MKIDLQRPCLATSNNCRNRLEDGIRNNFGHTYREIDDNLWMDYLDFANLDRFIRPRTAMHSEAAVLCSLMRSGAEAMREVGKTFNELEWRIGRGQSWQALPGSLGALVSYRTQHELSVRLPLETFNNSTWAVVDCLKRPHVAR